MGDQIDIVLIRSDGLVGRAERNRALRVDEHAFQQRIIRARHPIADRLIPSLGRGVLRVGQIQRLANLLKQTEELGLSGEVGGGVGRPLNHGRGVRERNELIHGFLPCSEWTGTNGGAVVWKKTGSRRGRCSRALEAPRPFRRPILVVSSSLKRFFGTLGQTRYRASRSYSWPVSNLA